MFMNFQMRIKVFLKNFLQFLFFHATRYQLVIFARNLTKQNFLNFTRTVQQKTEKAVEGHLFLNLLQTGFVGGFPNFGECDGGVESMENAERQCDAVNERPCDESIEIALNL